MKTVSGPVTKTTPVPTRRSATSTLHSGDSVAQEGVSNPSGHATSRGQEVAMIDRWE